MQKKKKSALTAIAIFVIYFILLLAADDDNDDGSLLAADGRRILSSINNSTMTRTTTVTIYLTRHNSPNPAFSIFQTDVLQKYGSGRVQFDVRENAQCDHMCNAEEGAAADTLIKNSDVQEGPCLAVNFFKCPLNKLKCNYPKCKTMITNDERCKHTEYDAREYYSSNLDQKGYLPLGPRLDSWRSLQKIHQSNPDVTLIPSSKRMYAMNSIFSQSTNIGRKALASIITKRKFSADVQIYTAMAEQWTHRHNKDKEDELTPESYMKVLLNSVFTVHPAGHNAECFRMYEAIMAGSIPIFVKDDLYNTDEDRRQHRRNQCKDSLTHWRTAPTVVLDSWHDLIPTVEELMADVNALDEIQQRLQVWYEEHMTKAVRDFEDFMLDGDSHTTETTSEDVEEERSQPTLDVAEPAVDVALTRARMLLMA